MEKGADAVAVDPITLEIIRNKFDMICEEMQVVLRRSCRSNVIKEAADALNAIFNPQGEFIAQSISIPCHLGMIIPIVQRIIQVFPLPEMRENDVYVMNDPHQGGTHLSDVALVVPIIFAGEVVALTACIGHQADIGGGAPNGKVMNATEIFAEGLIIPPLKLYDHGKKNETFYDMLRANVRLPDTVESDIEAQLASCHIGRRRVLSLYEEYGKDVLFEATNELMARSELMTRRKIAEIPDGIYSAEDYVDHDGVELDRQVLIRASVAIKGSEMIVDFSGTSPQTKGPINSTAGSSASAVYFVVRSITDPTIPNNAGCYRPIKIVLPEGSVVNPVPPAPVNARIPTVAIVGDVVMAAMAKAVPNKARATGGFSASPSFGGADPLTGVRFGFIDFIGGGEGARPMKDGADSRNSGIGNSANIPAEVIEISYPLLVKELRLRQDSGGAGMYQGGLGVIKRYEVLRGEIRLGYQGERHKTAPPGLFGGHGGKKEEVYIVRKDGERETVPSKGLRTLYAGDQLIIYVSGGGGYGNPQERDRRLIKQDLLNGKISEEFAKNIYRFNT